MPNAPIRYVLLLQTTKHSQIGAPCQQIQRISHYCRTVTSSSPFLDANRCHLDHPKFASCSILTRSRAKCWPVRAYFAPAEGDFIRSVGSQREGHSLPNEPAELWRRC